MIIITTMDELPEGCYECPLCHETDCMALVIRNDGRPYYQSAQEIRPYNCPLKKIGGEEIEGKENQGIDAQPAE